MSKQDKILAKRKSVEPNPHLDDVVNRKNLDRHVNNGIVKVATHPTLPLYLYDYSTLCERRSAWDGVTVTTRGLLRTNKGIVIGRPLQKFFSHGGKSTSAVVKGRFTDPFMAIEKVDGSMIIASNFDGELVLTTRGSFTAWQVEAARQLIPVGVMPNPGETWVLEFVSPNNRIVVEYDKDELFLLAVIDNWTGADNWDRYDEIDYFSKPQRWDVETVDDLYKMDPKDGSLEGFVVTWEKKGKPSPRTKVKFPSYNAKHLEIFNKVNS